MTEFSHGWKPLLAATVGTMCGLITLTNYTQGFFVGPVTNEFGWTPGEFFLSFTFMMCAGLITAPLVGSLVLYLGIRRLGLIGLVGHAMGYILISFNQGSLVSWYLSWITLAVLAAGSLPIIWTSVLNGWFVKNRGKAIGITMAGTGLGAFLFPPFVELFISNYGWRTAYRAIGICALIISFPIVFGLFREKTNDTLDNARNSLPDWGVTCQVAMRSTRFWILGVVLFLTVFVIVGLLSNFERIVSAKGVERDIIAGVAAIIGLSVIAGRLLVGVLVDRFWAPAVAAGFFVLPIAALLLLIHVPFTFGVGIIIALCIGFATGAELDLLAYLTAKYFGPKHYAKVFGGIFAFFTVGAGIAPPLYGELAIIGGSYSLPLYLSCVILGISIVLFLSLGPFPEEAVREEKMI